MNDNSHFVGKQFFPFSSNNVKEGSCIQEKSTGLSACYHLGIQTNGSSTNISSQPFSQTSDTLPGNSVSSLASLVSSKSDPSSICPPKVIYVSPLEVDQPMGVASREGTEEDYFCIKTVKLHDGTETNSQKSDTSPQQACPLLESFLKLIEWAENQPSLENNNDLPKETFETVTAETKKAHCLPSQIYTRQQQLRQQLKQERKRKKGTPTLNQKLKKAAKSIKRKIVKLLICNSNNDT